MKFNLTILVYLGVLVNHLYAQQPSHFILGKEEFSGVDIYDIFQDKKGVYWIASNNGLYKFDGYSFEKKACKEMVSNSVFTVKADAFDNIYCFNLSGQVFQIKDDTCRLFHEIPDTLISPFYDYSFDSNNEMIIATKQLYRVKNSREIEVLIPNNYFYCTEIYNAPDGAIFTFNYSTEELIIISKTNELIKKKLGKEVFESEKIPAHLELNGKHILYCSSSGQFIGRYNANWELESPIPWEEPSGSLSSFYSDKERIWVAKRSSGGVSWMTNGAIDKEFFRGNVISAFFIDNEGNVMLGTFGGGIIVLPNLKIKDLVVQEPNTKFTSITSNKKDIVFVGTQKGEVFQIDLNLNITTLVESNSNQIELLEYFDTRKSILINGFQGSEISLDGKTKQNWLTGSIKDFKKVYENQYIYSANTGVYWMYPEKNEIKKVTLYDERSNSVCYDTLNNLYYVGTAKGLKIGTESEAETILFKGEVIMCKQIIPYQNKVFIGTQKQGVLIFEKNRCIDQWSENKNLLSNNISKLDIYKNKMYVATEQGFQIIDITGEPLHSITTSDGLNSNKIIDFEIINETLWLLNTNSVQMIDLNQYFSEVYEPKLTLESVYVNDIRQQSLDGNYAHNESKFVFEIVSRSLKHKNDISYEYTLEGIDEVWYSADYYDNIIEYKSLPPGNYTFKAKAKYKKQNSELVTYAFTIAAPIWQRWWFYLLFAVTIIFLMVLIFRVQIKRIRKKNKIQNELSASKLTAIQSQMNPHFIFNSLNSIQDLVLRQDGENAYNYISKFALLVRKVLNQSNKEFIDINEEFETLRIYLELEQLRFKKDFTFNINLNDCGDIEIPPMLVQPFVENALKHGLLHKKGHKNLDIVFEMKSEALYCQIIDNGIGRQKSSEIKKRQAQKHESFSVKSIHTRVEILNKLYGGELGVSFEDLMEHNEAAGTKVVIKIPFNHKF